MMMALAILIVRWTRTTRKTWMQTFFVLRFGLPNSWNPYAGQNGLAHTAAQQLRVRVQQHNSTKNHTVKGQGLP